MEKLTLKRVLSLAAFPLLIAAIAVPIIIWRHEIWALFTSAGRLQSWIQDWGPWAPLVFIGVQILQVIVFVLPGEITQIAGGFLFGGWLGLLYSLSGILIGSTIAFWASRLLGRPFVAAIVSKEKLERVEKMVESRSAKVVFFLLFLIPGIPKDILCYVAGISPLRFPFFMLASTLGRLPGIIGSSVIGGAAADQKWGLLVIVSASALALFVAGLLLRPRIQAWIEKVAERRKK